jgi:isopropylmalate/homocitrate/citramalate synthase
MRVPPRVRVVEVGPRDGLQNETVPVATEVKVRLIDLLSEAGLPLIEAGSFVSPRWVPQMADSGAVLAAIRRRPGTRYAALIPNERGLADARSAGADEVAVFAAASETFSRRNTNCSIDEGLERFARVCSAAAGCGMPVRGYVSCALGCPYEGEVAVEAVARVAGALADLGCYEISLGDTIGVGTPRRAQAMVEAVAGRVPIERLALHFHDTYGQALANIVAALEIGVSTVDAAVAGLGGCPYAPGAAGNVATEDVLYLLAGLDAETGVDLDRVAEAGLYICRALGRAPASKAAAALAARRRDR